MWKNKKLRKRKERRPPAKVSVTCVNWEGFECYKCSGWVDKWTGISEKKGKLWRTRHQRGKCPELVIKNPPVKETKIEGFLGYPLSDLP